MRGVKPDNFEAEACNIREVKRIHETRRVRVRPTSLVEALVTSRKEVKPLVMESQTSVTSKKWRMDAFPDPQANCMQLQVRRVEVVVV